MTFRKLAQVPSVKSRELLSKLLTADATEPQGLLRIPHQGLPEGVDQALADYRKVAPLPPQLSHTGRVDVVMYAFARMLRAARLRGDQELVFSVGSALDRLLYEDAVVEAPPMFFGGETGSFIGSSLAIADACLADYICTGRLESLERGRRALNGAVERFWDEEREVLTANLRDPVLPTLGQQPSLSDADAESWTAVALRLLKDYGSLLNDTTDGRAYLRLGNRMLTHLSGVLNETRVVTAAFFDAALDYADPQHVIVVGPRSVEEAAGLTQQFPSRPVYPASGPVRADLKQKGPGFYLIDGVNIVGPLSRAQVAAKLAPSPRV